MQIYLVGGAVRDGLMNYPFVEKDWVIVGASEANIQTLLAEGYKPVGKDFPVFLHPDTKDEYALARVERKTGHGYGGFSFNTSADVSLEMDLSRRDLTINAIAKSSDGTIHDPYRGQDDIKNKTLRHVSLAFCEDPVRILRTARFAARYSDLGFKVAPETITLMKSMVQDGEADHLVAERVWKEMERALSEKSPCVFFETLLECDALAAILPEIFGLFGIPQRAEHHPEIDTGIHCLMVLNQASKLSAKTSVRLAALIHDLGKAQTPKDVLPRHIGHEQRSLPIIKEFCQRLRIPKEHSRLALLTAEFHTHCHRAMELRGSTLLKLFKSLDAFKRTELFEDFLLCCQADSQGRLGFEDRPYPQADYLRSALAAAELITAKEIQNQGFTGRQIGEQIDQQRCSTLEKFRKENGTTGSSDE